VGDNTASGTDNIATDELTTLNGAGSSGVKVQRVKVGFGDDGTFRDASTAFPLPFNLASSAGNGAQVGANLTAAGASTLAGTGNTTGSVVIDVSQAGNASFHLLAAAFVGTVVFEQSFDPAGANGTWALVPVVPEDALSAPMNTLAISTAVAYVRQFTIGMFGPKLFRVRCSAFTSGTLAVLGSAGPGWYEGQPALAPGANMIGSVSLAAATTYAVTTVNTNGTANTNSVSLAADTTRKGLLITNRGTVTLYVGYGTATSGGPPPTVYSVAIPAGQTYEVPPQFAPAAINTQASVVSSPVNFTTAV
jgi:hypothetical protein